MRQKTAPPLAVEAFSLIKHETMAVKVFILYIFDFIVHFLCLPKENEPKERAPCVPLDPALLETGGPFKNSAPKARGPQTA